MRFFALIFTTVLSTVAFSAPDEELLGKKQGYAVCAGAKGSMSAESCLVGVMSHYHVVYPSRTVKKGAETRPLKRAAQEPALGADKFLAEHRNTGLLVMKGDTILVERYQYERKPEHLFASMSMAKTIVGMLVGIALAEKKIASLDDLAQISGVGAKKLEAYGREILRVLEAA